MHLNRANVFFQADDYSARIEAYEGLLMDCKDALQVLRDELSEDPNFRQRQQASEGPVSSTHFLYTYLSFLKGTRTVDRNLEMVERAKEVLKKAEQGVGTPAKGDGRAKPVKPQDLVRLYEAIIANLSELPSLAGLEEDLAFAQETEARTTFFRAWRCAYIAQAFLAAQKWPEAMALFQRAVAHGNKAKVDKMLDGKYRDQVGSLVEMVESRQFMAHANSILEGEGVGEKVRRKTLVFTGSPVSCLMTFQVNKESSELSKLALAERLDEYYEDPELLKGMMTDNSCRFVSKCHFAQSVSGKPNLAPNFPPSFTPLPCKPLFFDLAREQLAFHNLESKMSAADGGGAGAKGEPGSPSHQGGAGGSGGWLGGWLGGWGGAKK